MRRISLYLTIVSLLAAACNSPENQNPKEVIPDFSKVSRVETGIPNAVMLTAYSTTLIAIGTDETRLRLAIVDSLSREITSADDSIRVYVNGDASLTAEDGSELVTRIDTAGNTYYACKLEDGLCYLWFVAGAIPDKVKIEARSGNLWPGGHEIHTLSGDVVLMKPSPEEIKEGTRKIERMIGADISFLPQIEQEWNRTFYENGVEVDAIELLKEHGFNAIRLRIFVNPENENGYSPEKGYCGLDHTLAMAHRVKKAGMKFLLDFHYSDYWADPQQQYIPAAWSELSFDALRDTMEAYTERVLLRMRSEGVMPDMVQVGNEINHGILWPAGYIGNPDQLAQLLIAGVNGVRAVDDNVPVMMHIALGGQNDEAVFWLDNMIARGVDFDIVGISYYPRWHGTLEDLYYNLHDLAKRYHKPVNVVEYNDFAPQVHEIVFGLPDDLGKGACIWEPLGRRSGWFDSQGKVNESVLVYDTLSAEYLPAY